ncbi:MAG: hypothetical protein OEY49_08105, partial [Candidatus Heimdallarchaeota archaeon]|nr:hypothetical protein [Candidatus Heimdallarchaeota archaeon]
FNNFTSIAEIRSSMLIELFGEGSTGKSSLSLYLSNCMIEQGKKVVYVISENFFNPNFMRGLIKEPNNLYISELDFIDDLEILINELFANKDKLNIGMIVIDSLISLLQRQFFVTNQDLSNLVRRQQKLKQILDKLKLLARLMNIIIIYTNHTRSGFEDEDETVALGGLTLGYAPHVRVQLEHVESKPMVQLKNTSTIPTTRCISIVDSSEFPSITKIFDLDDLQLNR